MQLLMIFSAKSSIFLYFPAFLKSIESLDMKSMYRQLFLLLICYLCTVLGDWTLNLEYSTTGNTLKGVKPNSKDTKMASRRL